MQEHSQYNSLRGKCSLCSTNKRSFLCAESACSDELLVRLVRHGALSLQTQSTTCNVQLICEPLVSSCYLSMSHLELYALTSQEVVDLPAADAASEAASEFSALPTEFAAPGSGAVH